LKIKPTDYLFVPLKNGEWLRDSQGKPRMYKSVAMALKNLTNHDYDVMQIFAIDDIVSKADFEKNLH